MNIYLARALRLTAVLLVVGAANTNAQDVVTLTYQDFESGSLPSTGGWSFGAQKGGKVEVSQDKNLNFGNSAGSLKGTYPIPIGEIYVWGGYDLSNLNTNSVYIDFWAKMPGAKQGFKFVKIFGQKTGAAKNEAANTTFGLEYSSGSMTQVSFGDGSTPSNDTQNVINLDGSYLDWIGRSLGSANILTPQRKIWSATQWGDAWHHFRLHVKFNSGTTAQNQKPDGEYYVEIDGVVYVDAKGIYNRHYSNAPIEKISLFDWAQGGSKSFEIWYDNIRITTGGFYSLAPMPPHGPTIKVN